MSINKLTPEEFIFPQLYNSVNDVIDATNLSITGGTYNSGSGVLSLATVNGQSLSINGFSTGGSGGTSTTLTGGTYNSTTGTLTLKNSNGTQVVVSGFTTTSSTGSTVFQNNITVSLSGGKTLGKYTNGQTIPSAGLTFEQFANLISIEFIAPSFSAFSISGQATPLESGTGIASGSKTFTWTTTTPSNVSGNSITIRNQTAGTTLLSNLADDSSEAYTLVSPIPLNGVTSQTFRILATDTQGTSFQRDFTVSSLYKIFYGDSSSAPSDSASVRALASNRFTNAGNSFTLNTGTVNKIFTVAMPSTNSLVSVIDSTASNADVTSQYVLSNFTVNDAGGNGVSYKVYTMTQAITYSPSHAHIITIS